MASAPHLKATYNIDEDVVAMNAAAEDELGEYRQQELDVYDLGFIALGFGLWFRV